MKNNNKMMSCPQPSLYAAADRLRGTTQEPVADYPQQVSGSTRWVLSSPISWCHSEVQPPLVGRSCPSTERGHKWFVYPDQDSQKHTQIQEFTHNVRQIFFLKKKKSTLP